MHFTVTNKLKQFEFVPLATLCSSYCYRSRFFWWAGIGKSKTFSFYRLVGSRFFQEVITVMDPNEECADKPLLFQKMSTTYWLVQGKVIYNILFNWKEIKAHFIVEEPNL